MYQVIVVGGGVIGGSILRELTKYRLKVCLVEKADDVCMGQSKANSGIVHAGFDAAVGSLKARFNVEGNAMFPAYAKELGVKYKNIGSLVVAFSNEEQQTLYELLERGKANGVPGLTIIEGEELHRMEPNLSPRAIAALYAPTAGIVCPYTLTIAAIGSAMDNGAELFTNFEVSRIEKKSGFTVYSKDGRAIEGQIIINCAGFGGERVAGLAGAHDIHMGGRRGEYLLLDRESGDTARHTLFFTPTALGKGILVSPTVDGNLLLGPTAEESDESVETTSAMLRQIVEKAKEMCPNVPDYNVITSFAGVRAYCSRHDFIIEESTEVKGFINCLGIESPGLTSAPAIAKYVAEELVGGILPLQRNPAFHGERRACSFKELSKEEQCALIAKNPAYGKIVCRCEEITEGEIIEAIHTNPPARSIDAIKRRTRAGMGRCQGGFCQPQVAEILARELNIPFDSVLKSGSGSELVLGRTK